MTSHNFKGVAVWAVIGLLLGCQKAPGKPILLGRTANGGSQEKEGDLKTPPTKIDPFQEVEKLSLAPITTDEPSRKNFDFAKLSEIFWINSSEFTMALPDGRSISFNFRNTAWSSVHARAAEPEFLTLYDFREAGFFGANAETLSFQSTDGKIMSMDLPDAYKASTLVAASPGFVAFRDQAKLSAILATKGKARLFSLPAGPAPIKLISPCNQNCVFWGFDGTKIYTYDEQGSWSVMNQTIELPAGQTIARMAIRFRDTNNPIAAESILVLSDTGALFAQVGNSVMKADPSWVEIKAISDRFCEQCHLDDGFGKESTWKSLKSSIVTRLKLMPGAKGSMPPIETAVGKEMSQGERDIILSWIAKQDQTQQGEIGSTKDPVVDTSDVTGELKNLSDQYCLSCHSDAKKNLFWKSKKADSKNRINSGNMPKGLAITPEEKQKFIAAIDAIK